MNTWVYFHCCRRYEISMKSLLTVTCGKTMQKNRIVDFPLLTATYIHISTILRQRIVAAEVTNNRNTLHWKYYVPACAFEHFSERVPVALQAHCSYRWLLLLILKRQSLDAVQTDDTLKCDAPSPASSVGIANRYGLDGPGIEFWEGRDFPLPSRPALGPTQNPIQWVPAHSLGVKRPGHSLNHLPPSSAEVKERVELYFYSPSGSSWSVIRWTSPF